MNNDQLKLDNLIHIYPLDVGSIINSRLVNSSSSEFTSYSNSSYHEEPLLEDRTNKCPAIIQPEVPSAVASPSLDYPSPTRKYDFHRSS